MSGQPYSYSATSTSRHAQPGAEALSEATILIPGHIDPLALLGPGDEILRSLERGLAPAKIHVLGSQIHLTGTTAQLALAENFITELLTMLEAGQQLSPGAVDRALSIVRSGIHRPSEVLGEDVLSARGKTIRPKSVGQKKYVEAIDAHPITFGIGPAGTGKTYLAMAKAVVSLQKREVSRIILTRPAVEAGESLGFLPGSLSDKIDPYVRPLYDALYDMLEPEHIPQLIAAGTIEVAPLAYMRGRTLNDAFVILDEAQNTTREQMKMFLTRLGFSSKMVITGDLTQVDLPSVSSSGLAHARQVLRDVPDIAIVELGSSDVVRNGLVADIIDAYDRWNLVNEPAQKAARPRASASARRMRRGS